MDHEFHYWITGILSARAGFPEDEARVIAYAANYTDHNDIEMKVEHKEGEGEPYFNYISQTMDITKPNTRRMIIYPCFHFVPGDPAAESAYRKDGKMHLLNTTPGNDNAVSLMKKAMECTGPTRPYRIGIAAHALADTWSHQNFVGLQEGFNSGDFKLAPKIGHAEALHFPDQVALRWQDRRLTNDNIDNNQRFLRAAGALYNLFRGGKYETGELNGVISDLGNALGVSNTVEVNGKAERRMDDYRKLAKACYGHDWLPEYNPEAWEDEALEKVIRLGEDSKTPSFLTGFIFFRDSYYWRRDIGDFKTSNWYLFQEAVKEHQNEAIKLFKKRFAKMGISMDQLKDWAQD